MYRSQKFGSLLLCWFFLTSCLITAVPGNQNSNKMSPYPKYVLRSTIVLACAAALTPFLKDAYAQGKFIEMAKCITFGTLFSYGMCSYRNYFAQGVCMALGTRAVIELTNKQSSIVSVSKYAGLAGLILALEKGAAKIDP